MTPKHEAPALAGYSSAVADCCEESSAILKGQSCEDRLDDLRKMADSCPRCDLRYRLLTDEVGTQSLLDAIAAVETAPSWWEMLSEKIGALRARIAGLPQTSTATLNKVPTSVAGGLKLELATRPHMGKESQAAPGRARWQRQADLPLEVKPSPVAGLAVIARDPRGRFSLVHPIAPAQLGRQTSIVTLRTTLSGTYTVWATSRAEPTLDQLVSDPSLPAEAYTEESKARVLEELVGEHTFGPPRTV